MDSLTKLIFYEMEKYDVLRFLIKNQANSYVKKECLKAKVRISCFLGIKFLTDLLIYDCCALKALNFSINRGTTSKASPTIP